MLSILDLAETKNRLPWKASLFVLFSSMLGFAIWSIWLGQDINWDLRNYHYYNPYALFSARLEYDIAPAQQQTFLNPALDLIPFLLISNFPPRVFGLVMGAWHGINLWLLFLIGKEFLVRINLPKASTWAALCALAGVLGAATVSEVGTTFHDLTLSVFVLGAIYAHLLAWPDFRRGSGQPSVQLMALSGFLLGLAVGFKLSFAIYGIGMVMAIVVVQLGCLSRYRGLLSFGFAALFGFLLTAGPWMWFLWMHYENPLFPFYNSIFRSPYYPAINTFDGRFLAKSAWDAISFPLNFNLTVHAGNELPFRDFRITVLYIGTLLAGVYVLLSSRLPETPGSELKNPQKSVFSVIWLFVFIWVTYLAWLKMFAVYRYLVCIELLSPIALVTLVGSISKTRASQTLLVTCLLVIVLTGRSPDWGRLPWTNEYFDVHPPSTQWGEKAVVLVSSDNPLAYVIPAFPEYIRFVRVDGNFLNPGQKTVLTDHIKSVISSSIENLYLLTYSSAVSQGVLTVNQYISEFAVTASSCAPVISRVDTSIVLCRLLSFKK